MHRGDAAAIPGQVQPQGVRQGEDPLAVARRRQDAIDQMGRGAGHAARAARRAYAARLAREGHQLVVAAGVAADPGEAALEAAARQEALELALDEARQGFWLFDPAPTSEVQGRFKSMLGPAIIERNKFKSEQLKFTGAIKYIAEYFGLLVNGLDDR